MTSLAVTITTTIIGPTEARFVVPLIPMQPSEQAAVDDEIDDLYVIEIAEPTTNIRSHGAVDLY